MVDSVVDQIIKYVKRPEVREFFKKGNLCPLYDQINLFNPNTGLFNFNAGDFTKFLIEKCDVKEPLYFCNNEIPMGYLCGHYDLKEYNIPPFITNIGTSAFSFCQSLQTVSIPKSVKYIGLQAFHACPNLKMVIYDGTTDDWSKIDRNWDWKDLGHMFVLRCKDGDVNV